MENRTEEYLGYQSRELIGRTLFDLVHVDDLQILLSAHQACSCLSLLCSIEEDCVCELLGKKNVCEKSVPYRILTKGEEWLSVQTSTEVQINSWTGKALFYICHNSISQWFVSSTPSSLSHLSRSSLGIPLKIDSHGRYRN